MDIYCPRCGEPHDTTNSFVGLPMFLEGKGCPGCKGKRVRPTTKAQMSRTLRNVLGNDPDGIAGMIEDLEYIGI